MQNRRHAARGGRHATNTSFSFSSTSSPSSSSSEGEGSASGSDASESGSGSDATSEDDDDEEGSDNEEEGGGNSGNTTSSNSDRAEPCTFDLSNLLAFNTHQVNSVELYKTKRSSSGKQNNNAEWYAAIPTIRAADASGTNSIDVNETLLLSKAAEGAAQLLAELWKLPSERTDAGLLAKLPTPGGAPCSSSSLKSCSCTIGMWFINMAGPYHHDVSALTI